MFNVRSPLDLKCSKFSAIFILLICDWWCLICQREGSTRLYDRQDQYGFSIVIIVFTRVILVNRMSSKAKYIAAACVLFNTCGSNWQKHRFSESFDLYFPLCVYHMLQWVFICVDAHHDLFVPHSLWHDRHRPMPLQLESWPPWLYDPSTDPSSREDIVTSQSAYMAISRRPLWGSRLLYGLLCAPQDMPPIQRGRDLLSVVGEWIRKIATAPKWSEPKAFDCWEFCAMYGPPLLVPGMVRPRAIDLNPLCQKRQANTILVGG